MNQRQINRVNMLETVLAYLDLHKEMIPATSEAAAIITKLKELDEAAWIKDDEKDAATAGKAERKIQIEKELLNQCLKVADGLYIWAKKNKNMEIKNLATVNKTVFKGLRDAEKVNKAKAIYNAAAGKDLVSVKITAEDINKLNELANEYKSNITDISSGAAARVAAGGTLEDMLNEAVFLLKDELDRCIFIYNAENPEFYNGYKAARVVWDKGGRREEGEEPVQEVQRTGS